MLPLLLMAAAVVVVSWAQSNTTQADIDMIVSMHNSARSKVQPTATNMLRVSWDPALAASAQQYADKCPSSHSGLPNLGENLSWGWPTMTAAEAVQEWINEAPNYSYDANICTAGKVCAHYTQMIWDNSAKVGCGVKSCPNMFGNPVADAWVCHYSPPGNFVGEKPFKSGPVACSACTNSTVCLENLCSPPGSPPSNNPGSNPGNSGSNPGASPSGYTPSGVAGTPAAAGTPGAARTPAATGLTSAGSTPGVTGTPGSTPGSAGIPGAAGIPGSTPGVAGTPGGFGDYARSPNSIATSPTGSSLPDPSSPTSMYGKDMPTPPGIGDVILDDPSLLESVLSPFTVVRAKNSTSITISEAANTANATNSVARPHEHEYGSDPIIPTADPAGNPSKSTIIGFPFRTYFE